MSADFMPAFELVLKLEGGLTPGDDNGQGRANRGITQVTLDGIRMKGGQWLTLPDRVEELTRNDTMMIYRDHYWFQSRAFEIKSQRLANAYFVSFINAWRVATKALQRAVGVGDDGAFGPITEKAVNGADPLVVLDAFKREMLRHYRNLAVENPGKYADDLGGWENRLEEL